MLLNFVLHTEIDSNSMQDDLDHWGVTITSLVEIIWDGSGGIWCREDGWEPLWDTQVSHTYSKGALPQ